ncbi:Uncharacterised protein [Candidatus Tiddalikarchaeum anstoanum]|nr:Uncharacterised protein [Candidatus Tiddalikarchaeum anstoanum]
MGKLCFLLLVLLTLNLVFAQEISGGIGGAPPIGQQGIPPTVIPQDVINAGASQEFIDMMCAMSRYHMQMFIDSMTAVKNHFDGIVSGFNGAITLNTNPINDIIIETNSKIDAVCSATPETFTAAMTDFNSLVIGQNTIEGRLSEIGDQLSEQLEAKGAELEARSIALLGGMTREQVESIAAEIEQKSVQIQSLQSQLQSGQGNPSVLGPELSSLVAELESLVRQISNIDTNQSAALKAEAEAFSSKISEVFGNVEAAMQAEVNSHDYSQLKAAANAKSYDLTIKLLDYALVNIEKAKIQLEQYGIDTLSLDEAKNFVESKKAEALTIFTPTQDEQTILEWIDEVKIAGQEQEQTMTQLLQNDVSNAWMVQFQMLEENADAGLTEARSRGLNTSIVEGYISELQQLKNDALSAINANNRELALAKLQEAENIIPLLQSAYAELQADNTNAADVAGILNIIQTNQLQIQNLVVTGNGNGVDTSTLDSLNNEISSLVNLAETAVNEGDIPQAISLTTQIREVYTSASTEYGQVMGEMQ